MVTSIKGLRNATPDKKASTGSRTSICNDCVSVSPVERIRIASGRIVLSRTTQETSRECREARETPDKSPEVHRK